MFKFNIFANKLLRNMPRTAQRYILLERSSNCGSKNKNPYFTKC